MTLCDKCRHLRTVDISTVNNPSKWIRVDYCRMIDAYVSDELLDGLSGLKNVKYPKECSKFKEKK